MELISAVGLLVLTTDPLGNIPTFISILQPVPERRRSPILIRELFFAVGIMLVFVFAGRSVTGLLGIEQAAISIAGALVLFLVALEMILPGRGRPGAGAEQPETEPFIVPLATPLIAGPSTLATIILITSKPGGTATAFWAVLIAWGITFLTLISAPLIMPVLKQRGARAVERLMGMMLVMLSVQMFLNGLGEYLRHR
jgi:multiple antibiotic resistance protein